MIEQTGVGRQIRPRRTADRLLIDDHQPFDFLQTAGDLAAYRLDLGFQPVVIVGRLAALTQFVADGLDEELADQARLARPRNSRDAREHAQGNVHIQTIKIVARHSAKLEPAAGVSGRLGNPVGLVEEVGSRPRLPHVCEARQRAAVHDLAALRSGVGADVDDPVRMPHDIEFVLDDE